MKADPISNELQSEYDKLFELWFDYPEDTPFEKVVKEHGTKDFQNHYFGMMERHKKLRAEGIIIN